MPGSSLLVFTGLGLGCRGCSGHRPIKRAADADAFGAGAGRQSFTRCCQALYIDQLYALTIQQLAWWIAKIANWLDRWVWSGCGVFLSLWRP